jgi:hypothetical protein
VTLLSVFDFFKRKGVKNTQEVILSPAEVALKSYMYGGPDVFSYSGKCFTNRLYKRKGN